MTQNATVKKKNEICKVIIIARFIYESTLIDAFGTTTFAVFRFFKRKLMYGT